jgi:hypothetical protein
MALIFAMMVNIASMLFFYFYSPIYQFNIMMKFAMMLIFEKMIPIFILRNEPISFQHSLMITILIFGIYMIYLELHHTNVIDIYKRIFLSIQNDDNNTPIFRLFHTLFGL